MLLKSFIDLAFILLCASVVLLSRSVQLGSIEAAPADVEAGQTQDVNPTQTRLIIVREDHLELDGQRYDNAASLSAQLTADSRLVLLPGADDLPHQRVMTAWSNLRSAGHDVQLGARPSTPASPEGGGG